MKIITFCSLFIVFGFKLNAQIGAVNFIDTTVPTAGISKILSYDLNNDGFKDIITSTTGTNGRLGFYTNQTNATFSAFNLIESFEFCRGFAMGNFNNDNILDIVAIGKPTNESKVYLSINGSYSSFTLDTHTMILNDVVVADFDQNNLDDIVIIGQHSIDFYRNNGLGSFTKEAILSTSTSPVVLECLDIAIKDMDNDGDMDIISGETAGLVIYTNNGNAVFTPNYYSTTTEVFFLVHSFDVDNDGDFDVVGRNGASQVKWFSNNGNGVMTYEATLSTVPNLISLSSIDYNNDGLEDIYASYTNHIAVFVNDSNHSFTNAINMHQNSGLIMGQVAIANIDNLGGLDYVWSGGNNTLAFHLNQTTLGLNHNNLNALTLYPNPTDGILNISEQVEKLSIYTIIGEKIMETSNATTIDIANLSAGIYLISIENDGKNSFQKIVKN
jgi:hypothetical protein